MWLGLDCHELACVALWRGLGRRIRKNSQFCRRFGRAKQALHRLGVKKRANLKPQSAAEKVARYKHAQLSAVRLAGDISGKMDDVTLDELLVTVRQEWAKLGPLIGLDPNQLLLLQGAENRSPVAVNGSEPEAISPLRRRSPSMGVSSA